jgi:hypothetical protein
MMLLLGLVVAIETAMIERCAALGVWLGSALRSPAGAVALAAVGALLMWGLRLGAFGLGWAISWEFFRRNGRPGFFWMWVLTCCGWEFALFSLMTPFFLWLARGSLRAPLGMRLGAWMIRTGERISGLGETDAAGGLLPLSGRGEERAAAASGRWKAWTIALWLLASAVFLAYFLTGVTDQEMNLGPHGGGLFFTLYAAIGVALVVVGWLVGRFVRRRIRASSEAEGQR